MFNKNTTQVSWFRPPISPTKDSSGRFVNANQTPNGQTLLFPVYQMIIGEGESGQRLRTLTENLRNISDPDPKTAHKLRGEYKKQNLPFITFGGSFSYRKIENLISASNLVCLDIDGQDQTPNLTPDDIPALRDRISQDGELDPVLLFRSPSGDGLKVVVNIRQEISSDDDFKRAYKSLENYIKQTYDLISDGSRKDIAGACFLCYDPEAICQESGQGFDVVRWTPVETGPPVPVRTDRPLRETMNLTDGPDDYERALIAVEDIESSGIDITSDRQEWMNIGFALATLGEDGRELFHRVSQFYEHYNRAETDTQFSSFLRGRSSNPISLDTLFYIASKHGVRMRSSNVYAMERNRADRQVSGSNPTNYPSGADNPVKQAENGSGKPAISQPEEPSPLWLLNPTTETEVIKRESSLPESLRTGYSVTDRETGETFKLLLCSGKLTTIAGASGHGKTLFLMNLLLNVAKANPEKRFILFTYEENSDTILGYLLNIYLNDLNLTREGTEWRSNRILIKDYFSGKGTDNINRNSVRDFNIRKSMFFKNYIENGRILIKYIDSDSTELCRFIQFLSAPETGVGGVFVDYFQCINPDPKKRFPSRQEALKSICFELKDTAKETGLPVVLACQFNQEVCSPTDVLLTKIGEAGDISRISAESWGFWQMGKDINRKLDNKEEQIVCKLTTQSEDIHNKDKYLKGMYLRVLKSRIAPTSSEGMFEFRGLTGKIYPNDSEEQDIIVDDWNRQDPTLLDDGDLPIA